MGYLALIDGLETYFYRNELNIYPEENDQAFQTFFDSLSNSRLWELLKDVEMLIEMEKT
jgi:hypothetical protein